MNRLGKVYWITEGTENIILDLIPNITIIGLVVTYLYDSALRHHEAFVWV